MRLVKHWRFYQTERGFQGQLAYLMQAEIPLHVLPSDAIVEEEYQKNRDVHGNRYRPDLIVHKPTPPEGVRNEGNYLVIALKLRASRSAASLDFAILDRLVQDLDYSRTIFIKIDSTATFSDAYKGPYRDRFLFVSTCLVDGRTHVLSDTCDP